MSFYSESKTSQKSFENGKLVDSSEEVLVNDNGNILVSVTGTPSKKVDIDAITNTLMKPTPNKSLFERLSELSQSMDQNKHKSKTEPKSKTEKRKKKSHTTTMKKKKMKRSALQSGENSRKKRNQTRNQEKESQKSKKK